MATAPFREIPQQLSDLASAIRQILRVQPWGALAGLLAGWTPLSALIVAPVVGAILGVIKGLIEIFLSPLLAPIFAPRGTPPPPPLEATIFANAFITTFQAFRVLNLGNILGALVTGAIVAAALTALGAAWEPTYLLRFKGYRRLSRREAALIMPLVTEVAAAMQTPRIPDMYAWDNPTPGAWAYCRSIVLSTALGLHAENRQAGDDELLALITHEMHHWRTGDHLGANFAWSAALPVIAPVWLLQNAPRLIAVILWFVFWPQWVLLRMLVAPAVGGQQRRQEYDADAAALRLGWREGMRLALARTQPMEPPRNRWEQVASAEHPAAELRLERLE